MLLISMHNLHLAVKCGPVFELKTSGGAIAWLAIQVQSSCDNLARYKYTSSLVSPYPCISHIMSPTALHDTPAVDRINALKAHSAALPPLAPWVEPAPTKADRA